MRRDFRLALFLGFLAALMWVPILRRLNDYFGDWAWALTLVIPAVFATGLCAGKLLSRSKPFFYPFAKFIIVGFFIAGIDFGAFNLLIYLMGIERGFEIAVFKAISFTLAVISGYPLNKFWTFRQGRAWRAQEFSRYFTVAVFGFAINVGLTGLIVNFIAPPFDISQLLWDNMASAAAIAVATIWNFSGYKFAVFKPSSFPIADEELRNQLH